MKILATAHRLGDLISISPEPGDNLAEELNYRGPMWTFYAALDGRRPFVESDRKVFVFTGPSSALSTNDQLGLWAILMQLTVLGATVYISSLDGAFRPGHHFEFEVDGGQIVHFVDKLVKKVAIRCHEDLLGPALADAA